MESSLVSRIGRVIRRLENIPGLLSGRIWDHPDTLDVSGLNSDAAKLGPGPILSIGQAPDFASWPNLPPDHPNNQNTIEALTLHHPDGSTYQIRRFNQFVEQHGLAAAETIACLKAWKTELTIAAERHAQPESSMSADGKADGKKKNRRILPKNNAVLRFARYADERKDEGIGKERLAQQFIDENEISGIKAASLARKLRDYPHLKNS